MIWMSSAYSLGTKLAVTALFVFIVIETGLVDPLRSWLQLEKVKAVFGTAVNWTTSPMW